MLALPGFRTVLESVDAWPATKLYLWFDRPWWLRDFTGGRTTTDLPPRKLFYFADRPDAPAALLAAYTDGRDTAPWAALYDGAPTGSPAPPAMLEAALGFLRTLHPTAGSVPEPVGSAFMYWGTDPLETGWHYWRAGARSDEVIASAPQVDPRLPVYLAGEAFSRAQAWVEGALDSAVAVVERVLAT